VVWEAEWTDGDACLKNVLNLSMYSTSIVIFHQSPAEHANTLYCKFVL